MRIADFALERYFARWEFEARYLLCASDLETLSLAELLDLSDDDTRALWRDLRLGYTESPGHPLLRAEIASLYERVTPGQVLTFVGAEEAIFLSMHALLVPGDHAVVLSPAYQSLYEVARSIGASVTLVPLNPTDWSLDIGAVERAVVRNTRAIVINFPHSPTGALLDQASFRRLVELAEARAITLFSDEVYRLLEFDAETRLPAGVDCGARVVSLGVMSKAFGLGGLRVGWIATHDASLLRRIAALKDYTTICGSAPSEVLALMALRARDRILQRNRAIIATNLLLLDRFFACHDRYFEWVRPRAGSVAFPRLRSTANGEIDRFCAELVQAEGVLLLPGSQFSHTGNHFRIGFGRRDMPQALERLERFALLHLARDDA
jgi:aspartate/methionine/tyrosine aminotransferase